MIAAAQKEGNKEAERTFTFANEVEKVHAELFEKALKTMETQVLVDIFVCSVCGHTVLGEPPERCPICNSLKKFFKKIE